MSFFLAAVGVVVFIVGVLLAVGALGGIPTYRREAGRARRKTLAVMIGAGVIGLVLIAAGSILMTGGA